MASRSELSPSIPTRGFATTHWTVVRACADAGAEGHAARSALCGQYWYPVYAHVMRRGHPGFDAADLTQDFFVRLLKRKWFEQADQMRGRFRSFLLVSLDHYLQDRLEGKKTLKRGRGYQHIPLELSGGSAHPVASVDDRRKLEQSYDASWALTVVGAALKRLEAEYADPGSPVAYASIKGYLTVEGSQISYDQTAAALDLSSEKLKGIIHRLRRRYGDLLREEVARTVASADDVADELRHLRAVLQGELGAA